MVKGPQYMVTTLVIEPFFKLDTPIKTWSPTVKDDDPSSTCLGKALMVVRALLPWDALLDWPGSPCAILAKKLSSYECISLSYSWVTSTSLPWHSYSVWHRVFVPIGTRTHPLWSKWTSWMGKFPHRLSSSLLKVELKVTAHLHFYESVRDPFLLVLATP